MEGAQEEGVGGAAPVLPDGRGHGPDGLRQLFPLEDTLPGGAHHRGDRPAGGGRRRPHPPPGRRAGPAGRQTGAHRGGGLRPGGIRPAGDGGGPGGGDRVGQQDLRRHPGPRQGFRGGERAAVHLPQDLPAGHGGEGRRRVPRGQGVHRLRRQGQRGVPALLCGRHLLQGHSQGVPGEKAGGGPGRLRQPGGAAPGQHGRGELPDRRGSGLGAVPVGHRGDGGLYPQAQRQPVPVPHRRVPLRAGQAEAL